MLGGCRKGQSNHNHKKKKKRRTKKEEDNLGNALPLDRAYFFFFFFLWGETFKTGKKMFLTRDKIILRRKKRKKVQVIHYMFSALSFTPQKKKSFLSLFSFYFKDTLKKIIIDIYIPLYVSIYMDMYALFNERDVKA